MLCLVVGMLVGVTYLDQHAPSALRPAATPAGSPRLVRTVCPSVALVRFFYRTIGCGHGWTSRLDWPDARWQESLARPGTEVWVYWYQERPSGYAELDGGWGPGGTATRIHYLGLLPEYREKGLGGHLLTEATRRAWTVHLRAAALPSVNRVVVDTCGLDARQALPNYLARGYRIVRETQEDRPVSPPGVPRPRAPEAARP